VLCSKTRRKLEPGARHMVRYVSRKGRKLRAGLELVAAVGALKTHALLQTRVGIATGLVVVGGLIGSGVSQEQAIVGGTCSPHDGQANVLRRFSKSPLGLRGWSWNHAQQTECGHHRLEFSTVSVVVGRVGPDKAKLRYFARDTP
jgi:hypothetical protein